MVCIVMGVTCLFKIVAVDLLQIAAPLAQLQQRTAPLRGQHGQFPADIPDGLHPKKPLLGALFRRPHTLQPVQRLCQRPGPVGPQLQKIPYMLVLGGKEAESGEVAVRDRRDGKTTTMLLADFVEKMKTEVETKAN